MSLVVVNKYEADNEANYYSAGSKPAKIWSRSTQRITADFC